ncbi:MAG: lipoyl(octanoyl) transferase LipB [Planctomycetota bacterium]
MTGKVDGSGGILVLEKGVVEYGEALELQRRIHAERVAGDRPDTLLLLTHPPTVTLGRAARREHLLLTPDDYRERGIEVHETDRGGDVTYHGPGQLVGYPIVDLRARDLGPRSFLRLLEESLILLLAEYRVAAERVAGLTGVWAAGKKVAAMGIRVSRGVSLHGFALNVTTDPADFEPIVPCGIREHGVTSLALLTSAPVTVEEAAERYPPLLDRCFRGEA